MRAKATCTLAAALALAVPAGADPGHGPLRVEIAHLSYRPADLTIVQGDLVVWEWAGPDINHSVTAENDVFDSDPEGDVGDHAVGDLYAHTFDEPGTFEYFCRTHPALMRGTVTVTPAGPTAKSTPPELSAVEARAKGRRLAVRFALNEDAQVRAVVRRVKGGAVVRRRSFAAPPGVSEHRLSLTGLKAGRYAVTLTPIDLTTRRAASSERRRFTLR